MADAYGTPNDSYGDVGGRGYGSPGGIAGQGFGAGYGTCVVGRRAGNSCGNGGENAPHG